MSDFLKDLLRIETAPPVQRETKAVTTAALRAKSDGAVEVDVPSSNPADAEKFLLENGFDPSAFEVSGVRHSEWTMANGEKGVSTKYTFNRVAPRGGELPLDDLLAALDAPPVERVRPPVGGGAFVMAMGDLQIGKIDKDGVEGTVARARHVIDSAVNVYLADPNPFPHVHLAWLGDHIEGFVSQGGANTPRTQLSLTQQTRIVRRLMAYQVERFAKVAPKVTVVAVPGNHGEPQRFAGKGLVSYDDSHDTEALIAVSEAARMVGDAYSHVEFYTPTSDEMTVTCEVGGLTFAHAHGHQWKPGRHFDWWRGQAFGRAVSLEHADVLLAGHLHHLLIEEDGPRTFIQVPALEGESTWWRHRTGSPGNPGALVLMVDGGSIVGMGAIR